jgi:hypothetical protein
MESSDEISLLEAKLNELKVAYDKYFAGVDRLEPARLREEVQRMVRRAGTLYISNTGLKFKRDSIVAQFNTHTQYWNRILKQIEDGTYSRDLFKMRLKERSTTTSPPPKPPKDAQKSEAQKGDVPAPGTTTNKKPATNEASVKAATGPEVEKTKTPASANAPKESPTPKSSGSTGTYASVFLSLVEAKHKLGEKTDNISYNALEKNLSAQAEAIKKKYKASRVHFKVEVKDGKPVIKAVPVK